MELSELCRKAKEIFEITNISELPDKLYDICLNNQHAYMERFIAIVEDLSVDWLQKIFQYYEADRKEKMQDYTPATLARLLGRLTETKEEKTVCDLCAGSGALTIQKWNLNHDLQFLCYEYDKRVIPLLLFNLAVRNIDAFVVNGDALQNETFAVYHVRRGDKFSTVMVCSGSACDDHFESCLSNPPYNMKWKYPPFVKLQSRFHDYDLPPENNANYAFILSALESCRHKAAMILPCGVLSTDNTREKKIRQQLVEKNSIEAVIACPDKMFEATSIPTCIIVFNKQKTTTRISFIDMRKTCEVEHREQNGQYGGASHKKRTYKKDIKVFSDRQIEKAMTSIASQDTIPGFSKTVSIQDVAGNDFNLVPSRYIDSPEQEIRHREYASIAADINRITAEKNACKLTINETLVKTLGFDIELYQQDQKDTGLNHLLQQLGAEPLIQQNYFATSKKKNEIRFENTSKDILSSVLIIVLNLWKQHIYYLNNEENRYLAEMRDALLPELMSGKSKV